ncbi:MAG: hypothetical protein CMM70_09145 [Rhodospirillaceae bacterium]|nr:hypothetical protein [Rhodospirillaceae bacterium]
MPIVQQPPRKSIRSFASFFGLAAGAVGGSELAQAVGDETASPMTLLPEHYALMENGLLLITDELAQASISSLPLMGSVRAQWLSDLTPITTIDGTVAEATPAQTLSITEGQAPRLSEQLELQTHEVAQLPDEENADFSLGSLVAITPLGMVLLSKLTRSDDLGEDQGSIEESAPPSLSNQAPEILEADAIGRMGRDVFGNAWSSDFDTSGPFLNAAGQVMPSSEPSVWPYARATDVDGDALVWALTGVSSTDYTGYDSDYDSPSELLAEFDIYWSDAGSAYFIWSDEIQNWYDGISSSLLASDTWTWEITVSDGNGLTDTASISLDFP